MQFDTFSFTFLENNTIIQYILEMSSIYNNTIIYNTEINDFGMLLIKIFWNITY